LDGGVAARVWGMVLVDEGIWELGVGCGG
jgi:hypothetical protein